MVWIRRALTAVSAGFAIFYLVRAATNLNSLSLRPGIIWLIIAVPLAFVSFPLLAVAWTLLLRACRLSVSFTDVFRIWSIAQLSRYVPTGLLALVSRADLARQLGVAPSTSLLTMSIEGGLLLLASTLSASALAVHAGYRVLLIPGGIALLSLTVTPFVVPRLADRVSGSPLLARIVNRLPGTNSDSLGELAYPRDSMALASATMTVVLSQMLKSLVFVTFALSLLNVRMRDLPILFGATNLSVIAGMLSVAPAGIGVRESVLVAVLEHRFGLANVTALTVAARVFEVLVELPWVIYAYSTWRGEASRAARGSRASADLQ